MPPFMPVRDRIYLHSIPEPNSGCWLWLSSVDKCGYGKLNVKPETLAHRASYREFVGPIPNGQEIDHKCRIRCCVNPNHLQTLPHLDNVRRRLPYLRANALKTHCKRGHPFSGENLLMEEWRGILMRKCKECKRQRMRARPRPEFIKGLPAKEYNRLRMRKWRLSGTALRGRARG
jgi:hypothetical protein